MSLWTALSEDLSVSAQEKAKRKAQEESGSSA